MCCQMTLELNVDVARGMVVEDTSASIHLVVCRLSS